MKSKDIALIVIAVVLGAIFSEVINKYIFVNKVGGQQVDIVPSISGNFPIPDSRYFNPSAIDPTQFISIGNSSNPNPFSSSSSASQQN